MAKRFEVIVQPSNDYMVWDINLNEPAMFGDRILDSMTEVEASAACEIMNEVHRRQMQKRGVRQTL